MAVDGALPRTTAPQQQSSAPPKAKCQAQDCPLLCPTRKTLNGEMPAPASVLEAAQTKMDSCCMHSSAHILTYTLMHVHILCVCVYICIPAHHTGLTRRMFNNKHLHAALKQWWPELHQGPTCGVTYLVLQHSLLS